MITVDYAAVLIELEQRKGKIEAAIAAVRNLTRSPISRDTKVAVGYAIAGNAAPVKYPSVERKGSKVAKCRSCGERIIWMKTKTGKNIPVDYSPEFAREKVFRFGEMVAHFTTCPHSEQHRKGDNAA